VGEVGWGTAQEKRRKASRLIKKKHKSNKALFRSSRAETLSKGGGWGRKKTEIEAADSPRDQAVHAALQKRAKERPSTVETKGAE